MKKPKKHPVYIYKRIITCFKTHYHTEFENTVQLIEDKMPLHHKITQECVHIYICVCVCVCVCYS